MLHIFKKYIWPDNFKMMKYFQLKKYFLQSVAKTVQKVCTSYLLSFFRVMISINVVQWKNRCCAKNIAKLRKIIAKLIETDMVNIFESAAFQKHIIFYCWMNKKTFSCNSYFVANFFQNVCKKRKNISITDIIVSLLSAFLKAIDH